MTEIKEFLEDKPQEDEGILQSRREFLGAGMKWSKAVVAGVLLGGVLVNSPEAAAQRRGRSAWANRRGGGGAWRNRGGAWANRSGGGGAWGNRSGVVRAWANRGKVWANRGSVWANRR